MKRPGERTRSGGDECRCVCGSLVARLVEDGVELKCRRCKRTLVVPLQAGALPVEPVGPPVYQDARREARPGALREAG